MYNEKLIRSISGIRFNAKLLATVTVLLGIFV